MLICESCCKLLAVEPSKNISTIIFSPFILSLFSDIDFRQSHLLKVRSALKNLLSYHSIQHYSKKLEKSRKIDVKMTLNEKIKIT